MFSQIQSTKYGFTNYTEGEFTFTRGHKQYELSNHLGNVLVTIQDSKWGRQNAPQTNCNYYLSYVVTVTDYHAFGSTITERSATFEGGYRFGFNNQEKESELGDYYAYKYCIHDARLGRFMSVDPLAAKYSWNRVYAFAENRVIDGIDLEGLEWAVTKDKKGNVLTTTYLGYEKDGKATEGTVPSVAFKGSIKDKNFFDNLQGNGFSEVLIHKTPASTIIGSKIGIIPRKNHADHCHFQGYRGDF